jgi:hypothetical protein
MVMTSAFYSDLITFTEPRVHAFVYEPTTGEMKRLSVDFKPYMEDMEGIYSVYQVGPKEADQTPVVTEKAASDSSRLL